MLTDKSTTDQNTLFLIITTTVYFPAQLVRRFIYPQRPSGQNHGHRSLPCPPRYVPSFLSRIGISIPPFQLCMLVEFHRIMPTHALVLSACPYFTQEKVPTSTNMTRKDSTLHHCISRDDIHLLRHRRHNRPR